MVDVTALHAHAGRALRWSYGASEQPMWGFAARSDELSRPVLDENQGLLEGLLPRASMALNTGWLHDHVEPRRRLQA